MCDQGLGQPTSERQVELHGIPCAADLVIAVRDYLDVGRSEDPAAKYFNRISINLLSIVCRELQIGPSQAMWWERSLAELGYDSASDISVAIRKGNASWRDSRLWLVLVQSIHARLMVANPKYLVDQPSVDTLAPPPE
jgi:hypothetical protein